MEQQTLSLEIRQGTGKSVTRKLRAEGKVPGVVYGHGKENVNVTADPRYLEKALLSEWGRNHVFALQGEGLTGKQAMIKDYQVDPVSRKLLHVDLYEVSATEKIYVTVPLHFVGKAKGVALEGGVLNIVLREVELRSLPGKVPEHLEVDVTELGIGDSIHLNDIQLPADVEKVGTENPTLVTCVHATSEEEATASLEGKEPERVTKEKKEESEEGTKKE